jgi:hypothetical protein
MALSIAGMLVLVAGTAQAAATTVPLGTAGTYAILAGSGITNTGITTISGDVGSSPTAAETGFAACPGANCVTLTGANHTSPNPNDAVTQGAKAALTNAYNNAAGQTPGVVLTELAGQTLVAGVYTSATGTFGMSGTLTLDGANNPNSVFIFQTASTLVTGGTANINLIRGAQACNIFWKIGSSATLGAGSTLDGTVMANTSISLGSGVTVIGRLLAGEQASGSGAVTLIHDTILRPTCAATPVTVPSASASATPAPKPSASTPAPSASAAAAAKSAAAVAAAAAAKAAAAKAAASAAALKAAVAKAAGPAGAGGGGIVAGAAPGAAPGAPQIQHVPVGAVHTGDGSSIPRAGSVPSVVAVGIACLGLVVAGAGVTASTLVHRRRRQR